MSEGDNSRPRKRVQPKKWVGPVLLLSRIRGWRTRRKEKDAEKLALSAEAQAEADKSLGAAEEMQRMGRGGIP